MSLDSSTLVQLRRSHPGWRLLLADHAPLVASFLQRAFIEPNVRVMAQPELESRLDADEQALYLDLCRDHLAPSLRLEQERIGFAHLLEALRVL